MLCPADTFIGLLLGASTFLFVLSVLGYRRSGIRTLILLSEGLAIHIAFTTSILAVAYATDWLVGVNCFMLVMVDAAVLAGAVVLGYLGGRSGAGSS